MYRVAQYSFSMAPRNWLVSAGQATLRIGRVALAGYLVVLLLLLLLENTLLYPAPRYPVGDWEAAELRP